MDPSPHQSITAARQLSLEECLAFIEKLERENAQKDTEINRLKEALERENEHRVKQLGDKDECNILTLINALTSRRTTEYFDNLHEQPPTGIELIVCVYPHLKAETQIELLTLIRWFDLLYSNVKEFGFEVAIKSCGFTEAKIRTNLLNALDLITEHEHEDLQPLISQLSKTIRDVLITSTQMFFTKDDKQTLRKFKELADKGITSPTIEDSRKTTLHSVYVVVNRILENRLLPKPSLQKRK
ncbi:hypothetical protein BLNAU_24085 [Blattamonas nauphoetae]|uniref:Uncharacterized protein n=1 Tax=Blattamonas nauphoetae TaxID=2049346 RepID=A0ABQ9WNF3_9EUKA|nr:hypothetical protein BLNAU_24085 [Blattamonas nauphoetae]